MDVQTLWRPVGLREMELILAANSRAFPPRLDWQPFFYPVFNFRYAEQIAREWNCEDALSGFCGFVTRFHLPTAVVERYPVRTVGNDWHRELWVPGEELPALNARLIGPIEILATHFGARFSGVVPDAGPFAGLCADEQFLKIALAVFDSPRELPAMLADARNGDLLALNGPFWAQVGPVRFGLSPGDYFAVLAAIRAALAPGDGGGITDGTLSSPMASP